MNRIQPFHRIMALTAAYTAALMAAAALPANSMDRIEVVRRRDDALAQLLRYESRGHGGKKPRHPSKRFVAQDKRDARKARNKRRGW